MLNTPVTIGAPIRPTPEQVSYKEVSVCQDLTPRQIVEINGLSVIFDYIPNVIM